jgi:metal-responsive CopG/Arc/MetJ family transcriptional regulator
VYTMLNIGVKGEQSLKANLNIPEDVLKKIDRKAELLGISRSAFVTMTMSEKLMQTDTMENFPKLLDALVKMVESDGE